MIAVGPVVGARYGITTPNVALTCPMPGAMFSLVIVNENSICLASSCSTVGLVALPAAQASKDASPAAAWRMDLRVRANGRLVFGVRFIVLLPSKKAHGFVN